MIETKTEASTYVGPAIRTSISMGRFTTFRNGVLPIEIEEYVSENPELKQFFIPVSKLQEVMNEGNDPKSFFSQNLRKIQRKLGGK
ncbi:MAG: hypothetical protein GY760_26465 [Deltaproteobacteria bacterium]|nr:hypothetical protein [Deltaproteobacteria bacterium]